MKRQSFKKGYMILHFAVAVSIVLIGIKILIGFGQTSAKTIGKGIDKIEQSYESYKWKKNEPKRIAESIQRQKIQSEEGRKNLIKFIKYGCENSAWQMGDMGAHDKKMIFVTYEKEYIDHCLSVAYQLIIETRSGDVRQFFGQYNPQRHFNRYLNWFIWNRSLMQYRKEHKPDYLKEMLK